MRFLELPVRNLRSHRTRSALTAVGIAIALAGMLALLGLSRGIERNWALSIGGNGTHLVAFKKGAIELLSPSLDQTMAEAMRRVPGVAAVTPNLGDLVELDTGQMALLSGWPMDGDFWSSLRIVQGRPPASETEGVVLGESLAELLASKPGSSIQLSGQDFKVAAVARQPSVIDNRSVMIPLPAMQRLLGREGKVSGFHVRVRHPEDAAEMARVESALASAFPELSFAQTGELIRNNHVMRLLRAMAWCSSTIALAMAFVAVLNTLLMSVTERTRELGLLCAVGWHPARVMGLVALEGLLLAAMGAALGTARGQSAGASSRHVAERSAVGSLGLVGSRLHPGVLAAGAGASFHVGRRRRLPVLQRRYDLDAGALAVSARLRPPGLRRGSGAPDLGLLGRRHTLLLGAAAGRVAAHACRAGEHCAAGIHAAAAAARPARRQLAGDGPLRASVRLYAEADLRAGAVVRGAVEPPGPAGLCGGAARLARRPEFYARREPVLARPPHSQGQEFLGRAGPRRVLEHAPRHQGLFVEPGEDRAVGGILPRAGLAAQHVTGLAAHGLFAHGGLAGPQEMVLHHITDRQVAAQDPIGPPLRAQHLGAVTPGRGEPDHRRAAGRGHRQNPHTGTRRVCHRP